MCVCACTFANTLSIQHPYLTNTHTRTHAPLPVHQCSWGAYMHTYVHTYILAYIPTLIPLNVRVLREEERGGACLGGQVDGGGGGGGHAEALGGARDDRAGVWVGVPYACVCMWVCGMGWVYDEGVSGCARVSACMCVYEVFPTPLSPTESHHRQTKQTTHPSRPGRTWGSPSGMRVSRRSGPARPCAGSTPGGLGPCG